MSGRLVSTGHWCLARIVPAFEDLNCISGSSLLFSQSLLHSPSYVSSMGDKFVARRIVFSVFSDIMSVLSEDPIDQSNCRLQ
jgi:hypothetical protein